MFKNKKRYYIQRQLQLLYFQQHFANFSLVLHSFHTTFKNLKYCLWICENIYIVQITNEVTYRKLNDSIFMNVIYNFNFLYNIFPFEETSSLFFWSILKIFSKPFCYMFHFVWIFLFQRSFNVLMNLVYLLS